MDNGKDNRNEDEALSPDDKIKAETTEVVPSDKSLMTSSSEKEGGDNYYKPSFMERINFGKIFKYLIIIAIVGVGAYFISKNLLAGNNLEVANIKTEKAVRSDIVVELSGKGTVEPLDKYNVSTLVKGEVLKAPFEEGQNVDKGDLLFQVSTEDIENGIKSAELSVKRAKKNYSDTMDGLNDLSISSKVSGYVKETYYEKGDIIAAGAVIADIYDESKMLIDLPFPADQVNSSWIGKTAKIEIDGSLETIYGKVTEIGKFEEVLTGNIIAKKVTIQVKNPGGISTQTAAIGSVGDVDCNDYGTFRPFTEDKILADKSGEISSFHLKKGNYVKKGSVVIRLSDKTVQSQIESNKLGIEESELTLETQQNQLDNYRIEAPISGQVILKNKKAGDTIDPQDGTGPLAIIYDLSALTFKMSIDELDIMKIKVGQKVNIAVDAIAGEGFQGIVENISLNSTTVNGVTSYPVLVRIDVIGALLPGMNVTGKIITNEVKNVITVPAAAIVRGDYVYVKDQNYVADETSKDTNKVNAEVDGADTAPAGFIKTKVETGLSDGAIIEIKSGLKENDEVYIPEKEYMASTDGESFTMFGGGEADVSTQE